MVAISLYRGNLHKLPDGLRRWTLPTPKISREDFKILTRRRAKALARLRSSSSSAAATKPNPKPGPESDPNPKNSILIPNPPPDNKNDKEPTETELTPPEDLKEKKAEEGRREKEGGEDAPKKLGKDKANDASVGKKNEKNVNNVERKEEAQSDPDVEERRKSEHATSDKEKTIKEIEEKLEVLNQKKHNLVQVLKLILSAEEQMKKQNSMQGTSGRPPLPLQVDTTDSVSVTRVNTPRMGSDGNPRGRTGGGETDDGLNQNVRSRQLPRMSSTSPSSDSQHRKPASNMVPRSYKTSMGVAAGSPSCFGPAGLGHPSVSVSGTSYIASSPSPAASGGTSIFRDVRLPSPLN